MTTGPSRRRFHRQLAAGLAASAAPLPPPFPTGALPHGIRSRLIPGVNGLSMHILEAGFDPSSRPLVLLLHGFPELAFSWRRIIPTLAAAGYHVIAPDQRGFGRTTGWDGRYSSDFTSFRLLNLVHDALALLSALGIRSASAVVGHDFGSPVAAWCALIRPDVFRSVVLMSAPFAGPPSLPFNTAAAPPPPPTTSIHDQLAAHHPPRKHYQWYFSTPAADADMRFCSQGIHAFLRAYFHMKSADWKPNQPFPIQAWTAPELAKLPRYYVMDLHKDMAETVAPEMPSPQAIAACPWLTEDDLRVYASEFARTGFQGGLQWYRCSTSPTANADLALFSSRPITVPACFIAGRSDWGVYQRPGSFQTMQRSACSQFRGAHLIDGAGHWVQQEQPQQVSHLLLDFLHQATPPPA